MSRVKLLMKSLIILLGLMALLLASACIELRPPLLGLASKYKTARFDLTKPRGAGVNKAIPLLEEIAQNDPLYKDTLTLLGRAYYQKERYQDALQFLQRAVLVNKEDDVAWLVLGLVQLRLGDDQKGLESFKGGLSLLYKFSNKDGYRGYQTRDGEFWDKNGLIRHAVRRAIFRVQKDGLGRKDRLIRDGELILRRMNDEEAYQRVDKLMKRPSD